MVRVNQDQGYARYYSLLKIKLFTERSLPELAHKELKDLQKESLAQQDFVVYYQAMRKELNYLSSKAIPEITEQGLIEKQLQAKLSLKSLHTLNEHFSLYELLHHRLIVQTEDVELSSKTSNFDDLALSELAIVTRGTQHLFNSKKLHLLFQAYFFMEKRRFQSAMQTFMELNTLMESNAQRWDWPPYDYLSTLKGIVSSLSEANQYNEMPYFLQKIELLLTNSYPEHFLTLCIYTRLLYKVEVLVNNAEFDRASDELKSFEPAIYRTELSLGSDDHLRILFYGGLSAFKCKKFKLSLLYLSFALNSYRKKARNSYYSLCLMLYLMIHSELGNYKIVESELKIFKGLALESKNLTQFFHAFFLVSKFPVASSSKAQRRRLWSKVESIVMDDNIPWEFQRLLNVETWIRKRLIE
jgi:hypothetical protein